MTNSDSGTVSVIDTATNTITRTILLAFFRDESCIEAPLPGAQPRSIAINPDGTRAYVTMFISCYLTVIDTQLSQPIDYIFPARRRSTRDLVVSPSGDRTYVTANYALLVLDNATDTIVATSTLGDQPGGVAVLPDGRFVYAANGLTAPPGSISVVDTTTDAQTASIAVGNDPEGVAITPDGRTAYVATREGVNVVDTESNTVVANISVPTFLSHIAITPDGRAAYVSGCGAGTCVIDTATNTRKPDILGRGEGIAITADGARAYLTQPSSDAVAVISTAANAVTARIRMPHCGRLYDNPPNLKAPCSPTGIAIASVPHGCPACPGDCNTDGTVTINEVMSLVNIVLGNSSVGTCPAADPNRDGQVTIHEILRAVNVLLFSHDLGSCWAGLASGQALDEYGVPSGPSPRAAVLAAREALESDRWSQ